MRVLGFLLAAPLLMCDATAQGYRLRIDSRVQVAAFRGLLADSIPIANARPDPVTGGLVSPDGFAVDCSGGTFCRFFRPGEPRRSGPLSTRADLLLWGLGVPGLTVRVHTRHATDLGADNAWPGTTPSLQLLEGYAEYTRGDLAVRAGRLLLTGRLGFAGVDGGRVAFDWPAARLLASVYGGWGLARGVALPVTSPVLNPLDDFQPRDRQLVAGADIEWRADLGSLRGEYRREVDPATDFFVSERMALSGTLRPVRGVHAVAGAEWDLAMGHLGSTDARLTYATTLGSATLGYRRYQPFFDLWTIWGAFSPVPYSAYSAQVTARPRPAIELRARGERFSYEETGANTPLVQSEDAGWRWSVESTWTPSPRWSAEAGTHREFGPGASTQGYDGRVAFQPRADLSVAVHGGWLERPLEFRFSDAELRWVGAQVDASPSDRWRFSMQAARYAEARQRPDAAAFDFNQWRLTARVTLTLRSKADQTWLPPRLGPSGAKP